MAIADITKPMALDETLQATNGKMDSVITKLQGIIDALGLDPSVYKPAGSKTCAELLPALLIADNLGNVYNITDSGTTTSDFVEGSGKPIPAGSNVAIVDIGTGGSHVYKFDLLAGMIDLTNYVQKSATAGLIKNDGTIDPKNYAEKPSASTSGNLASLDGNGNLADSGWKSDKTTTAVSGNPISISGLKSNQLAINPIITFEPIQAGSGDPSPSNVRAISGYNKIEVLSCGKNIFDDSKAEFSSYTYSYNNGTFSNVATDSRDFFAFSVVAFDKDNNVLAGPGIEVRAIGRTAVGVYVGNQQTKYIMIGHSGASTDIKITYNIKLTGYFVISLNVLGYNPSVANGLSFNDIQIEEGQIATTYEPYNKTTDLSLQIGQTVYGGTLDVRTGKLTVDRVYRSWKWGDGVDAVNFTNVQRRIFGIGTEYGYDGSKWLTNVTNTLLYDADADVVHYYYESTILVLFMPLNTDGNTEIQLVHPLATPYTIQLTPHEISLLKGYAYLSTNGTNIAFDYHNGEMASLGDVAEVGKTINLLGDVVSGIFSHKVALTDNFVAPGNGIASVYVLQNQGSASSTNINVNEDNEVVFSHSIWWNGGWAGTTILVPLRKGHTYTFTCDTSPASINFNDNRSYFIY